MLPFFIYWGVILACIAWLALSVYFSVFTLYAKKMEIFGLLLYST